MITTITDTCILTEKTYTSNLEHDTLYRVKTEDIDIQFSTSDFESNLFEDLKLQCTDTVFKNFDSDMRFRLQPQYLGMDVDIYIGRGKTVMNYCIVNQHIIVVSTGDEYPGTRWLMIEGIWKIIEETE
jgi:hypothetical protein